MTNLIIDTAGEKIFLKIISDGKEYINKYDNCREKFDELVKIIFNFFFSIVGVYLLPIFIVLVIEKKIVSLFLNLQKFDLIIFFIFAVILFLTLPENPRYDGVGIIYKFLSLLSYKLNLNWNVILYLYYISNLFFLILIITFF